MATPTIALDQTPLSAGTPGSSRSDLALSVPVVCTDPANGAGTYAWELVVPPGSSATLSGAATDTATFTPDVRGTYLVYLVFNGSDASYTLDADSNKITTQGGAAVTMRNGVRPLGVGESFQFHSQNGYAEDFHPHFATIDAVLAAKGASHGSVFYSDVNGDLAALGAGTAGQVLETAGPGANPAWATPSGGGTLQSAYDGGANILTGAGGAVSILRSSSDTTSALSVTKAPGTSQSGSALSVNTGGSAIGAAIGITNGGTGPALEWDAGQSQAPDGTAAAPAYSFSASPATGIYSDGTNRIAFTTNTQRRVVIDANGRIVMIGGGAVGAPAIGLTASTSGLYWPSATSFAVSAAGAQAQLWSNATGVPVSTITKDAVGTSDADEMVGLMLENTTAAASGAQQYSPLLVMVGSGWSTAASEQEVRFAQQVQPIEGSSVPTAELVVSVSVENDASGAYREIAAFVSGTSGSNGGFAIREDNRLYLDNDRDTFFEAPNGGDRINFNVGSAGAERMRLLPNQFIVVPVGTSAVPSFVPAREDTDTGFYSDAANTLSISTGATEAVTWNASQQTVLPEGSESAPSLTFSEDNSDGIYHSSNNLYITIGGNAVARFSSNSIRFWEYLSPISNYSVSLGTASIHWNQIYVGEAIIEPQANTSGSLNDIYYEAPGHTGLTASTEVESVHFDMSATKQWAAGALATQRFFRVDAPTVAFAGASTLTDAATMYIGGAPAEGTNATITNAYALWVDDGAARLDGDLDHRGSNVGFYGATPVAQSAPYSTLGSTDRSFSSSNLSTTELTDILGTLIGDLQAVGIIG